MANDVDLTIRAKDATAAAFKAVSEALKALEDETGRIKPPAPPPGSTEAWKAWSKENSDSITALNTSMLTARQGIADVVNQAKGFVHEFAEEERATAQLTAALRSQGSYTPELVDQYVKLASAYQSTTTYADELIQKSESLLVTVGHVMPEQMDGALKAATDLATGLGIDLGSATMLLAKSLGQGGEELGRLKGYLGDTKIEGEGAAAVLGAIEQRFGGQAQEAAKTYAGKMQQVANSTSDAQEEMGKLMAKGMTPLIDLFQQLPGPAQTAVAMVGSLVPVAGSAGMALMGFSQAIPLVISLLGTALPIAGAAAATLFTTTLPAAFAAVLPFLGPGALIVGGIVAVYEAWKHWDAIVAFFKGAWTSVTGAIAKVPDSLLPLLGPIGGIVLAFRHWDEITGFVKGVYEGVKTWLVDKFNAVVDGVRSKVDSVTNAFANMYDKVVGHSFVPDMVTAIGGHFGRLDGLMVGPAGAAASGVANIFQGLAGRIPSLLQGLFSNVGSSGQGGIGSMLGGLLGGSQKGGLLGEGVTTGLTSMFNSAAPAITNLFGMGLSTALGAAIPGVGALLGPLLTKGLGAAWNGIKSMFGPDKAELEGRDAADQFRRSLQLTEEQLRGVEIAAQGVWKGNEAGAKTVIAVRDAYIAAGRSEREALDVVDRLWKAEKQGGDAVHQVIDEITRTMNTGLKPAVESTTSAAAFGFEAVQSELRRLQDTAKDPTALTALQHQFEAAAAAGVTDFSFMANSIAQIKADIAKPVTIPITFATSSTYLTPHGSGSNPEDDYNSAPAGPGELAKQYFADAIGNETYYAYWLRHNGGDAHRSTAAFTGNGVDAAAAQQATANAWGNLPPDVRAYYESHGQMPPGFETGSRGLRDFGLGTTAILHGREEVITERQGEGVAAMVERALGRLGGADGTQATITEIRAMRRELADLPLAFERAMFVAVAKARA